MDLVWEHLSEEATTALQGMHGSPEEQHGALAKELGFEHYEDDERERIILDYLYHNLRFAHEAGFSAAQASAFFSIMKTVLDTARQERLEAGTWPAVETAFGHFKRLVLLHSVVTEDGEGQQLFGKEHVAALTKFVTESFFRHFSAYKVVFTREQDVAAVTKTVVVATPFTPPPLAEATQES